MSSPSEGPERAVDRNAVDPPTGRARVYRVDFAVLTFMVMGILFVVIGLGLILWTGRALPRRVTVGFGGVILALGARFTWKAALDRLTPEDRRWLDEGGTD